MNITTHNENRELINTVSWGDDPVATFDVYGDELESRLGSPYWFERAYPCWWVAFGNAQFLIRQQFPEWIDDVAEENSWCVIGDFISTGIHLTDNIIRDLRSRGEYIKVIGKSRLHVGKSTKLPLPDRRTA